MRITVGRGNNRNTYQIPAAGHVIGKYGKMEKADSKDAKLVREHVAEDLKNYLFRPKLLLKPRQQAAVKKAA